MHYVPISYLDTNRLMSNDYLFISFGIKNTSIVSEGSAFFDLSKQRFLKVQNNSGSRGIFINRKFKAISKLNKYPLSITLVNADLVPF